MFHLLDATIDQWIHSTCIHAFIPLKCHLLNSILYRLKNKLNFFLHVSSTFVNLEIIATMRNAISTIHQPLDIEIEN